MCVSQGDRRDNIIFNDMVSLAVRMTLIIIGEVSTELYIIKTITTQRLAEFPIVYGKLKIMAFELTHCSVG